MRSGHPPFIQLAVFAGACALLTGATVRAQQSANGTPAEEPIRIAAGEPFGDGGHEHASASGENGGFLSYHSIHKHEGLHFAHPLVAESPSPDTKAHFGYRFANISGSEKRHTLRFEGEYAFNRNLSVLVEAPYTLLNRSGASSTERLGNTGVAIKYANFTFEQHGLLLGGGFQAELPTGNEEKGIGSDHEVEAAPFLDFGYRRGKWELVGFVEFGFPGNRNGEDEKDYEVGWNASLLYHVSPRIEALVELDGEHPFGGEEEGFEPINITPGVKVRPFESVPQLKVGAGVSLPLTSDRSFEARPIVSLFYHF